MAKITNVVVVGGGTAGWLSAAYLARTLGKQLTITLVESPTVGTIGVGEGTANTFPQTMQFLGLEERDWMPRCNATYKMGIFYDRWTAPKAHDPQPSYFHCFFRRPDRLIAPFPADGMFFGGTGFSIFYYWLQRHLRGEQREFSEFCGPHKRIAELRRAPHPLASSGQPDPGLTYGYHLDASRLGTVLREVAEAHGVRHRYAHVVGAVKDERGFITHLETREGPPIHGDLFIDCSGFRRLLIGDAMDEPWTSYERHLLCDRAVALRMPHDLTKTSGLRPYTTATALSSGWAWEIPLFTRTGCGYVYSSDSLDRDAAERELRTFLGPGAEDIPAHHLGMRIGRSRRMWVNNCVAIGLSGAFVEPLEASTIVVMEYTLFNLVHHFPNMGWDEGRTARFNQIMSNAYDAVRDFIVLHYVLSDRDDSDFWRRVRNDTVVPDSLRARLEVLREGVVEPSQHGGSPFALKSWACILSGMRFPFNRSPPVLDYFDDDYAASVLEQSASASDALARSLPDNAAFLSELHGRPPKSDTEAPIEATPGDAFESGGCR